MLHITTTSLPLEHPRHRAAPGIGVLRLRPSTAKVKDHDRRKVHSRTPSGDARQHTPGGARHQQGHRVGSGETGTIVRQVQRQQPTHDGARHVTTGDVTTPKHTDSSMEHPATIRRSSWKLPCGPSDDLRCVGLCPASPTFHKVRWHSVQARTTITDQSDR